MSGEVWFHGGVRRLGWLGVALLGGCNAVLGLGDYRDADGGAGGSSGPGATATSSSVGGAGGATATTVTTGSSSGGGGSSAGTHGAPITITTTTSAVSAGYSLYVDIDHADLVQKGISDPSGNDVQVLFNGTPIDRVVDPKSAWGLSSTRIWFDTQQSIDPSTVDMSYRLVLGASGPVLDNPQEVFVAFEDFDGSALPTNWLFNDTAFVKGSHSVDMGQLRLSLAGAGDIFGTADTFEWAHRPATGSDVVVKSCMAGTSTSTSTSAKIGGVMLRETMDAGSRHMTLTMTDAPIDRVIALARLGIDGNTNDFNVPATTPPLCVRISLVGDVGDMQWSGDGLVWNDIEQYTITNFMPARIGIPAAGGPDGTGGTAVIDHFTMRFAVAAPPTATIGDAMPSTP